MKDHLEDKLNMILATEQVMNETSGLSNVIGAMVTAVSRLGSKRAEIQGVRGMQEQDLRGIPIDKEEKKGDAIEAALVVIGGLKAFARATGNSHLLRHAH